MISEIAFCREHSSLWRGLAPTTDFLVRAINAAWYERFRPPMKEATAPHRRAFINEIAFALFRESVRARKGWFDREPTQAEIAKATSAARNTIVKIDGSDSGCKEDPGDEEQGDFLDQSDRLLRFFLARQSIDSLVVEPSFPGCGIIDSCSGDVLAAGTLYEIKAGDRQFRSLDIRQLLVYAALNYAAHAHQISKLGLINPRMGVFFEIDLEDACVEISGSGSADLLSSIVQTISGADISR